MIRINLDVVLAKKKMSVTELSEKVGITMANISILKNGKAKERRLYNEGFKRKRPSYDRSIDRCPNPMPGVSTTSLIDRLKAQKCELCGATDNLVMHHVRKLGELKGKENWEKLMIARRRKTMAACGSCHQKIHHGTF